MPVEGELRRFSSAPTTRGQFSYNSFISSNWKIHSFDFDLANDYIFIGDRESGQIIGYHFNGKIFCVSPQGNQYSLFCLLLFIFWTLRSFFGTAVVLLRISPRMYNSTTAVPKKLRSVRKIKSNKQKRDYWFLFDQSQFQRQLQSF